MGDDGAQAVEQHVRVVLDRRHGMAREQFREQAHHHLAVFEHVRHAGGHAQVVFENVELALPRAHDIDAGDMRVNAVGHVESLHFRAVLRVLQHLLCGNAAGLENFLVVIDIVEKQVQCLDPLSQPGSERLPFSRRKYPRDDIEWNQPLGARLLAIDREGDTDTVKQRIGLGPLLRNPLGWRFLKPVGKATIVRTNRSIRIDHFVEKVARHVTPVLPPIPGRRPLSSPG